MTRSCVSGSSAKHLELWFAFNCRPAKNQDCCVFSFLLHVSASTGPPCLKLVRHLEVPFAPGILTFMARAAHPPRGHVLSQEAFELKKPETPGSGP
eukprot:CAMPEP_0117478632 /NCGR_PEP_ID=MMETSP0784-20121206/11463_1 /TAXON_ID=39447 /ORGANISM="" /LENGTH=95 /DNA_ID=CAMNT_0005273021 /DNA_START=107 /DNA_END=394 /DNA_ORIENTATION=+